jgi:hypothetical protein
MPDILIDIARANIEALDAALRDTLSDAVHGISTGPEGVRVHLAHEARPAQIDEARQIVLAHDPDTLTDRQQKRAERESKLATVRGDITGLLDPDDYAAADEAVRLLAARLAWLELEMLALRGEV